MKKNQQYKETHLFGVVDINDENFDSDLINFVKEFGIVVIKNVMSSNECDLYTEQTIDALEQVSHFRRNDLETWIPQNLPQQVRPGMFHEVICNIPSVNAIRFNPNIIRIFKVYYSHFKDKHYDDIDLIVSNDGVNIKPGLVPPYESGIDWAHIDQTEDSDKPFKCIQGQMVLSNTSACFRASPKSHKLFSNYLAQSENANGKGNFLKFRAEQYPLMQKKLENIGGSWQIKIPAMKGDFIIWTSSTVHSATLQEKPERPVKMDKWNGWRHVVYVCYRTRDEFKEEELKKKYQSFLENRVTNHWSTMIFPKGFNKKSKKNDYSEKVCNFSEEPQSVYDIKGLRPNLTNEQQIMMGRAK